MIETCATCGFDGGLWTERDCGSWLGFAPTWRQQALAGVDAAALRDLSVGPATGGDPWQEVHQLSHWQMDVARRLCELGVGTAPGAGRVVQVNVSAGGVPKRPVAGPVRVGLAGVEGDAQKVRKHHGRPFQALSLWSDEVIAAFAAEGHPMARGSVGENLTIAGLDWPQLRPGSLLRIGTVLAEVSADATPCKQQTPWFSDGDWGRMSIERAPDRVRWYAWVREPGTVATGDDVVVQPKG